MGIVLNWSSSYPTSIDALAPNFPVLTDGTHDVMASHVNELASAVISLETVVGGFRSTQVADPLSPSNGDVLTYNSSSGVWEASAGGSGASLSGLFLWRWNEADTSQLGSTNVRLYPGSTSEILTDTVTVDLVNYAGPALDFTFEMDSGTGGVDNEVSLRPITDLTLPNRFHLEYEFSYIENPSAGGNTGFAWMICDSTLNWGYGWTHSASGGEFFIVENGDLSQLNTSAGAGADMVRGDEGRPGLRVYVTVDRGTVTVSGTEPEFRLGFRAQSLSADNWVVDMTDDNEWTAWSTSWSGIVLDTLAMGHSGGDEGALTLRTKMIGPRVYKHPMDL